jgi:8-oxo-dGTP pyrophosphatase MutT (NUDIX family)
MIYKGRAQCLVVRDNKILMVKHKQGDAEWYCSPGGGIEKGETPEQAAVRELQEECNVSGTIIKKTSEYVDPYDDSNFFYTYHIDIGSETPCLGHDPKERKTHSLVEVRWMSLNEISELSRAFLWASGLVSIREFAEELESWSEDISYPNKWLNGSKNYET